MEIGFAWEILFENFNILTTLTGNFHFLEHTHARAESKFPDDDDDGSL